MMKYYYTGLAAGIILGSVATAILIGALTWFGLVVTFTPPSPYQTASAHTHIQRDCPLTLAEQDAVVFWSGKMEELK